MKKIILTTILAFICCFIFAENTKASYTFDYGSYYSDAHGYWDEQKQQATTTFPGDYSWFWIWTFEEDDNGVISVYNYNTHEKYTSGQVLSGLRFFDTIYSPRVYRSQSGDLSLLRNGGYNLEWALFNNIDKVTLYIDLTDVQNYYDKYGDLPEVIYVVDEYKSIMNDIAYYWTPSTLVQNVIEYISPVDLGDWDPIKNLAVISDYFLNTDFEEKLKTNIEAYITFAVNDFEIEADDLKWYSITNGYYPITRSGETRLDVCYGLEYHIAQLARIAETESNGCYSLNFTTYYDTIDKKCDFYIKKHTTPKTGNEYACSSLCKTLSTQAKNMCNIKDDKNKCGIGPKTMGWFMRVLKIGRYFVPVLVIIFSILDFISAIASAEEDAIKKSTTRFAKRVAAAIIIFLLPAFLQFLFDTFKIAGLNSSNPYCMK